MIQTEEKGEKGDNLWLGTEQGWPIPGRLALDGFGDLHAKWSKEITLQYYISLLQTEERGDNLIELGWSIPSRLTMNDVGDVGRLNYINNCYVTGKGKRWPSLSGNWTLLVYHSQTGNGWSPTKGKLKKASQKKLQNLRQIKYLRFLK